MRARLIHLNVRYVLMLSFFVLAMIGCKKRDAKRDIQGDWIITACKGIFYNSCTDQGDYFDVSDDVFGTITFDGRKMKRDYALFSSADSCYKFAAEDDLVRWKVDEYREQLIIAHQYILDIDGESWNLLFGEEAVGQLPLDQDQIYLSHFSNDGDAFSIELTRDRD